VAQSLRELEDTHPKLTLKYMFLVNTRKRNKDGAFGHEMMPKGKYSVSGIPFMAVS